MESLLENKALLYSLAASAGAIMMLTTGISDDFSNQFEIVPMPDNVGLVMIITWYVYLAPFVEA